MRARAGVLAIALLLGSSLLAEAHDATPVASPSAGAPDLEMVLTERVEYVTNIDLVDSGPSAGDQIIWGPDPLFDEQNQNDTGAITQGICISFATNGDCLLQETIVFPDGSTLLLQGVQPGEARPSTRGIVGGTGIYRGATGTVMVAPSADLAVWTKTFEIWLND